MIHFFESKTKNFYYLNLDNLDEKNKNHFEKINLKIDFDIPRHHCSVISNEGFILLLGGLDGEEQISFSDKLYILDLENETLVDLTPMNKKRAGMSAIFTNNGIFVVGGILENLEVTTTCELYVVGDDEWTE